MDVGGGEMQARTRHAAGQDSEERADLRTKRTAAVEEEVVGKAPLGIEPVHSSAALGKPVVSSQ